MGISAAYSGHLFKLIAAYLHKCGKGKSDIASLTVQGRTVDFKNTLIIMTSNVGSSVIEKGGGGLGFQLDTNEEDSSYNRIKTLVNEELKQYFRPEFLNRQALCSLLDFTCRYRFQYTIAGIYVGIMLRLKAHREIVAQRTGRCIQC